MSNDTKSPIAYVYYRDIPLVLQTYITSNPTLSYTKDGVMQGIGHNCPRLTVKLMKSGLDTDKNIIIKLEKILNELESNNQIALFNMVVAK